MRFLPKIFEKYLLLTDFVVTVFSGKRPSFMPKTSPPQSPRDASFNVNEASL